MGTNDRKRWLSEVWARAVAKTPERERHFTTSSGPWVTLTPRARGNTPVSACRPRSITGARRLEPQTRHSVVSRKCAASVTDKLRLSDCGRARGGVGVHGSPYERST